MIGVDPFIEELQRLADGVVSAFADDWSIEVSGAAQLHTVIRAAKCMRFEGVSGQEGNADKTAVVPDRRLTQ